MSEQSVETLNLPYARKVLEHLVAHPDEHRQDLYGQRTPCGTAACIAGTTVLMDPKTEIFWDSNGFMGNDVKVDGEMMDIDNRAAALLGLAAEDIVELFYEFNNKRALSKLHDLIADAESA